MDYNNRCVSTNRLTSNTKKTGFLAALDNTVCFLPLQSFVDSQRLDYLLKVLSDEAKGTPLSSLRASQYPIEQSWIEQGQVAQVELIEWSRGLIFPEANQSYVTVIGGLSVCLIRDFLAHTL